jgi:hypothetical protein
VDGSGKRPRRDRRGYEDEDQNAMVAAAVKRWMGVGKDHAVTGAATRIRIRTLW